MKNLQEAILTPSVRTFKLVGGTGDGKTSFTTFPASPDARSILRKCVGKTNSTVQERKIVYTSAEAYRSQILVAASIKNAPVEKVEFEDKIIKAIRDTLMNWYVRKNTDYHFLQALKSNFSKSDNTKAYACLEKPILENLIIKLNEVYTRNDINEWFFEIYNTAKNNIPVKIGTTINDITKNKGFKSLVENKVREKLSEEKKVLQDFYVIYNEMNDCIKSLFFKYFDKNNISKDSLYYKVIDLKEPDHDKEFINIMFSANDIQSGQMLSLEVVCDKFYIYAPMDSLVVDILNNNPTINEVFKNEYGDYYFSVIDTRGLGHTDKELEEDRLKDSFEDLLYIDKDVDAILLFLPLNMGVNSKKLIEAYKSVLKDYKKNTPVILINNKIDLFIDDIIKEEKEKADDFNPFCPSYQAIKINSKEQLCHIENKTLELLNIFKNEQGKNTTKNNIKNIVCFFKGGDSLNEDVRELYGAANAMNALFKITYNSVMDKAEKIKVKTDVNEISFRYGIVNIRTVPKLTNL